MQLADEISGYLETAYLNWQQQCAQVGDQFAQSLRAWLTRILSSLPNIDWRREWQAFVDEWELRGVEIDDPQQLFAFLSDWQRDAEKAWASGAELAVVDLSRDEESTASSELGTAEERQSLERSLDWFFADAEANREERRQEQIESRKKAAADAALKQRQYILGVLGNDWNNIPWTAVDRLRKEGLVALNTAVGSLSNLRPMVVIELPRADGGTDSIVLSQEKPVFSPPYWKREAFAADSTAAAAFAPFDRLDAQRHAFVMRIHGGIAQAQMGVYEILASGGSWPLIVQGLDQLLTSGRNLASKEKHDSAIVAMATEFYQRQMGLSPEQAKKAAERFDELLPLIAGVGEVGLNKIKETVNRPAAAESGGEVGGQEQPASCAEIERGNLFNRLRRPKYPYNEIYVEKPSGGRGVVDSYNPRTGEIVSRKATQFAEISDSSGIAYVREAASKYVPGSRIASVPTSGELAGKPLEGKVYLEVPIQSKPIPEAVLRAARRYDVIIRDVTGKAY